MWDEKGRRLITLVFRSGQPIRYEYADPENPDESGACTYQKRKLAKGDEEICPEYADVQGGFRAMKDEASFKVPAEKDPRTRDSSGTKAP